MKMTSPKMTEAIFSSSCIILSAIIIDPLPETWEWLVIWNLGGISDPNLDARSILDWHPERLDHFRGKATFYRFWLKICFPWNFQFLNQTWPNFQMQKFSLKSKISPTLISLMTLWETAAKVLNSKSGSIF